MIFVVLTKTGNCNYLGEEGEIKGGIRKKRGCKSAGLDFWVEVLTRYFLLQDLDRNG